MLCYCRVLIKGTESAAGPIPTSVGQKASGGFKNTSELDKPLVLSAKKLVLLQFGHLLPCAVRG